MGICVYTARKDELIVLVHWVDKDNFSKATLTKTKTYMVKQDTTVVNLKEKIQESLGYFTYEQTLTQNGRELLDDEKVSNLTQRHKKIHCDLSVYPELEIEGLTEYSKKIERQN